VPALLTRISIFPFREMTSCDHLSRAFRVSDVKLENLTVAVPGPDQGESFFGRTREVFRVIDDDVSPRLESFTAIALPMPLEPPVMRATLSWSDG